MAAEARGGQVMADARLYLTRDETRLVPDGDPDAWTLFCTPGTVLAREVAERYRMLDQDQEVKAEAENPGSESEGDTEEGASEGQADDEQESEADASDDEGSETDTPQKLAAASRRRPAQRKPRAARTKPRSAEDTGKSDGSTS